MSSIFVFFLYFRERLWSFLDFFNEIGCFLLDFRGRHLPQYFWVNSRNILFNWCYAITGIRVHGHVAHGNLHLRVGVAVRRLVIILVEGPQRHRRTIWKHNVLPMAVRSHHNILHVTLPLLATHNQLDVILANNRLLLFRLRIKLQTGKWILFKFELWWLDFLLQDRCELNVTVLSVVFWCLSILLGLLHHYHPTERLYS